jgi:hypothetical protein
MVVYEGVDAGGDGSVAGGPPTGGKVSCGRPSPAPQAKSVTADVAARIESFERFMGLLRSLVAATLVGSPFET